MQGNKLIIHMNKAIVRPHLEYFVQAWILYRKKDIDTLCVAASSVNMFKTRLTHISGQVTHR